MGKWYSEHEDPFTLSGNVRLIVARHNPHRNFRGELDNVTHILHVDTFRTGFMCPEKAKFNNQSPYMGLLEEEVEGCEHQINHLFKNLPNGIYELVGQIYNWSSQNFEGEWDGDSEIRNSNIREISFDHAMYFHCEPIYDELVKFVPMKEPGIPFSNRYDIHPYMTRTQILTNQLNSLNRIVNRYNYGFITDYDNMSEVDLENTIHMLMLQIDSEKDHEESRVLALEIDKKTQQVLATNRDMMGVDDNG